ncbi:dTDP-4-dehydrorhamnose reductase [Rothia sp. ZJ1223]|uniref:dTDP-4-dehydrorhamnose reductase n=1 Tax=Rothia sp. ZJ1223 TaxID=2811098 RepID=UPI001956A017|nr:dTDP-4-dehydrorhamnose reductase [Rothia sp. ZJ1223]MBM7051395.1 dTDP-4-dehydrorhamnose reductase [Rothia sp. ZJ1223]
MAKELAIHETKIPGLLIIDLPVHGDNRGWFKENWQREKMVAAGLPDFGPVQNNISFNAAAGTTRGIHAEPWDKFVSVATGKIFGAWVDLREGESFGKTVTVELGPDTAVYVPRGVGNSFQTLEDNTAYTYVVNDHWSADAQGEYSFLNLADETVAIDWPILLEQAELSDKDKNHPRLTDVVAVKPAPILVVGAGGQLGKELVRQLEASGAPFVATTRETLDIADPASWQGTFRWRSFSAIINAAAYTAVDTAETSEGRVAAWAANATGVAALAAVAREANIPLVHVSTDYVFDGSLPLGEEYTADAPLAPLGVYGQSKAAGEAAVAVVPRHYIVRTSWVIGEGKNFVEIMKSLAERGINPSVVADQHGRPTFTEDLAGAILHLLKTQANYGTYHVSNTGDIVTWAALAQKVFELTGHDATRVSETTTAEYFAKSEIFAPRPTNSAMNLSKIIAAGFTPRDHGIALESYLAKNQ